MPYREVLTQIFSASGTLQPGTIAEFSEEQIKSLKGFISESDVPPPSPPEPQPERNPVQPPFEPEPSIIGTPAENPDGERNPVQPPKIEETDPRLIFFNAAEESDLTALPFIGKATATKIVNARNPEFKSLDEVKEISGLKPEQWTEVLSKVAV